MLGGCLIEDIVAPLVTRATKAATVKNEVSAIQQASSSHGQLLESRDLMRAGRSGAFPAPGICDFARTASFGRSFLNQTFIPRLEAGKAFAEDCVCVLCLSRK